MARLALAVLLLAPFLLGLNRPLAWSAATIALALPFVFARTPVAAVSGSSRALLGVAAAFALGLPLLQLAGGTCSTVPSAWPCTTSPEQSALSLLLALMLLLWFLLLTGPRRPATDTLLKALALTGALQAVYGMAVHFLGATPLFMEHVYRHADVPTGGFPNRNHLAAFLYIGIFAGIALVLRLPGDTGTGRAGRWRLLLDQRLLWRLLVVLMVLALIATRSRAGNAGFMIGLLAGFAWLMLVERRRQRPGSGQHQPLRWRFVVLVIASVLLLDALLIGSFVGLEKVQQRIADTSVEGEQRADVNATLLAHPELFTVAGHGAGSFLTAFEPVKPADAWPLYDQAHNDYLQVLVERGWLGALLFAAGMMLLLRSALRPGRPGRGAEVRFAFVAATSALLVHGTVEYVTQQPAIWLAWLALAALAVTASAPRAGTAARKPAPAPGS